MSGNPCGGTRPQFLAPYSANHNRVRKVRGNARDQACAECAGQARDWAIIHGEDGADPENYRPLCRRCHYRYDQETQQAGVARRSASTAWQASRASIPRDSFGRYARV